jgi:hypothetical protein
VSRQVDASPPSVAQRYKHPPRFFNSFPEKRKMQLRGRRNFDDWHRITKHLEPFGQKNAASSFSVRPTTTGMTGSGRSDIVRDTTVPARAVATGD